MRLLFACVIATTCLAPAALAASNPTASWGKPGVTFEQYRQDAVECGTAAYYVDVSETEAAQAFRRATQQLEATEAPVYAANIPPNAGATAIVSAAQIVAATRPQKRLQEVRDYQDAALAICLRDRGYKRFSLTADQRDHLRRLKNGSAERHQYLYDLSVDPRVLNTQGV